MGLDEEHPAPADMADESGMTPGFDHVSLPGNGTEVDALIGGKGPPLLLLRGSRLRAARCCHRRRPDDPRWYLQTPALGGSIGSPHDILRFPHNQRWCRERSCARKVSLKTQQPHRVQVQPMPHIWYREINGSLTAGHASTAVLGRKAANTQGRLMQFEGVA